MFQQYALSSYALTCALLRLRPSLSLSPPTPTDPARDGMVRCSAVQGTASYGTITMLLFAVLFCRVKS